jgi:hypothetical protein
MSVTIVAAEAEARLDWLALTRALEAGHKRPRPRSGIRSSTGGATRS